LPPHKLNFKTRSKGQLPLVTARNCDSLRVSAHAVLFYNSGCRHPLRHALRSRVSELRNRRRRCGARCCVKLKRPGRRLFVVAAGSPGAAIAADGIPPARGPTTTARVIVGPVFVIRCRGDQGEQWVVILVYNAILVMCLSCWGYTFVVPR